MEEFNFSVEEIREELLRLGYYNVPSEKIREFKRDLDNLIREDRNLYTSLSTSVSDTSDSYRDDDAWRRGPQGRAIAKDYAENTETSDVSSGQLYINSSKRDAVKNGHSETYIPQGSGRPRTAPPGGATKPAVLKSCLKKTSYAVDRGNVINRSKGPSFYSSHAGVRSDPSDTSSVASVDSTHDSSTSTERRFIKRKVLRKQNGQVEICSRSVTDDLSCLEEQINNLELNILNNRPFSAPPKTSVSENSDHDSHVACREQLSYNLPEDYEGPKALIRPMSSEPHMKNIRKTDPVSRYQSYKQSWDMCRAPGERSHKQLRWDIRGQMLQHDQVVIKKPQPVYQPNPYVIPSDKKRKTLRWQIRNDLAQGIKPPSMFD